jgi:hypothetical protein
MTIKKTVKIGEREVSVVAEKKVAADRSVTFLVTATVASGAEAVHYEEVWTLPHDNHEYSKEQAQKDFDAHIERVARGAVGRAVAHEVSESLT